MGTISKSIIRHELTNHLAKPLWIPINRSLGSASCEINLFPGDFQFQEKKFGRCSGKQSVHILAWISPRTPTRTNVWRLKGRLWWAGGPEYSLPRFARFCCQCFLLGGAIPTALAVPEENIRRLHFPSHILAIICFFHGATPLDTVSAPSRKGASPDLP